MPEFCTQESCAIDANGRFKLSSGTLRDFMQHTEGDVVLYCIPEGSIGIFPPDTWQRIREPDTDPVSRFARDVVYRRTQRWFGAMTFGTTISGQGRITLPPTYRDFAGLEAPGTITLVGNELGVEVWHPARWQAELDSISQHVQSKSLHAMRADLTEADSPQP